MKIEHNTCKLVDSVNKNKVKVNYNYELGLIIGRFQPLHNGHREMIQTALNLCTRVVVYIGSSQEEKTKTNPFSYDLRKQMFEKVFSKEMTFGRLLVRPLPDIGFGNNDIWGRYVLGTFEAEFGRQPDLYITGCEKDRSSWFNNEIAPKIDELRITRGHIEVSGTQIREAFRLNDTLILEQYVPKELREDFLKYKSVISHIPANEPIWVYRFEHLDPKKGAWYNKNGKYCCTNSKLKLVNMPYEPDIYQGTYKSSCQNSQDLAKWISREVAEELLKEGFIAVKYLTTDYFFRAFSDHKEVCFNKNTFKERVIISLDEMYKE